MKVLIACEYSGRVRDAFTLLGHDAMSCDLLPSEMSGKHYQGDILDIIDDGWDLMIAHPPCTYLSNCGARHLWPKGKLNPERFALGMNAKEFFVKLLEAPIEKICIENPVPSKVFGLPKYTQIIQPYYFGDPYQKRTCLWLKNLPALLYVKPKEKPASTKQVGGWFNKGGKDRQKERAKTFPGIANAFADQFGAI